MIFFFGPVGLPYILVWSGLVTEDFRTCCCAGKCWLMMCLFAQESQLSSYLESLLNLAWPLTERPTCHPTTPHQTRGTSPSGVSVQLSPAEGNDAVAPLLSFCSFLSHSAASLSPHSHPSLRRKEWEQQEGRRGQGKGVNKPMCNHDDRIHLCISSVCVKRSNKSLQP